MIQAQGIVRRFDGRMVLNGVDFRIAEGEAAAIIGRSGCGKSVLLRILIGLLPADSGRVVVLGHDLGALDERGLLGIRQQCGMLFQAAALFDSMTVEENIGFLLRRHGQCSPTELARRVAEALDLVGLPGIQAQKPAELSGGMRKRVGLARAIVHRPRIVFYDEPTTGLDPVSADSIDRLIEQVCAKFHITTVVVTHDMRTVRRIAQRVLMLHEGRVYASGTPPEIFGSADPVVRRFVDGVSDPREVTL